MKILPITATALAAAFGLVTAGFAAAQDASSPMASPNAASNPAMKSPDMMTGAALAKGHNSFTKAEASSRIAKAGYSNVTDLVLDGDGLWQAHAMKDGQPVSVALDYKGNVAAQ